MSFPAYMTGLTTGLSLIVAIGAQNAFVMRQGLRNEYVFAVCLACGLSDAVLIVLGVTSFRQIVALLPWFDPIMWYGGSAFLIWYGAGSLSSALLVVRRARGQQGGIIELSADSCDLPRAHMAQSACLSRYGRAARHDLDQISGARGFVRGGHHDRLFPVLLFAWLRRDMAATDLRQTVVLAHTGNADRDYDVDDRRQAVGWDVIPRSQRIVGKGADSGPSLSDRYTPALGPDETIACREPSF
jgi:hypothetical protein